jgi:hypothetical protein
VCLPCVVLAALTSPDDLLDVCHGGWPLEVVPEGLPDEGSGGRVVPTHPTLYVREQLSSFFNCDAFLFDPQSALFVKCPIDEQGGLCFTG